MIQDLLKYGAVLTDDGWSQVTWDVWEHIMVAMYRDSEFVRMRELCDDFTR